MTTCLPIQSHAMHYPFQKLNYPSLHSLASHILHLLRSNLGSKSEKLLHPFPLSVVFKKSENIPYPILHYIRLHSITLDYYTPFDTYILSITLHKLRVPYTIFIPFNPSLIHPKTLHFRPFSTIPQKTISP